MACSQNCDRPTRMRALAMNPRKRAPSAAPSERPGAAEDADPADDDRGDDLERVAARGRPVDRPEFDDVHDPGDAGQQAAQGEGHEDDQPRRDAEDGGRLRVAADRVELPAEPGPAQEDRPDHDDDDRDEDEDRDPEDVVVGGVGEARRQAGQRDLVAARDQVVDAAEDAQRAEGRDDRRDPQDRDDEAVDHPEHEPDADPEQDRAARRRTCGSRARRRRSRRPGPSSPRPTGRRSG